MPNSPSIGPAHGDHDRLLIARLTVGDAAGTDRDQALAQLAACGACRDLIADLGTIARAVAAMPPPSRPIGSDFRLSGLEARRLARGGWWRRALGSLGSTRGSMLAPAAATMMTIGLAGLLLTAGSLLQIGATGAAPRKAALAPTQVISEPAPTSSGSPAASADGLGTPAAATSAPSGRRESDVPFLAFGPTTSPAPAAVAGQSRTQAPGGATDAITSSPEGRPSDAPVVDRSLLAMVSGLLLVAGVGLLLLRRAAVRSS